MQQELELLLERFSALEAESSTVDIAPAEGLLVVRADGIKQSKRFLKDELENPRYRTALHKAVGITFRMWRDWAPEPSRPFILAALRLSDEVSFVLNRGDNYYGRRILKITTTLASTLSGAMSLAIAPPVARKSPRMLSVAAFDGRPLILGGEDELVSYIRCRRLLHARNAMAKVLRLESEFSDSQLYDEAPRLADDIHRLGREVGARSLWDRFDRAVSGSALYTAGSGKELDGRTLPGDPQDEGIVRQAVERACGKGRRR
ncbi:hypothetical protein G6O69_20960 [Pseudenhygromyxa sp. WMMC2535]|uniref:tRNA(His) guanylyltransferase Thg1 family protein n=1 Tax=Pseudenhygromyxa sp. WMMC2535 TaxID=2712867 RepID=UPI001557F1FA|nr:tRNA(His) guanylyltransferase Thg1 family protein [Pseudenhygromyxa sp. WMMC2535]NVB40324.1 hypothetical protein [Pseudenhygromyxa sp. WMMC2535]